MPTLIICPACGTRYETTAQFPPEGRKVRCSKCTHVWQAHPVSQPAAQQDMTPAAPQPMAPPPRQAQPPAMQPPPAPPAQNTPQPGFGGFERAPAAPQGNTFAGNGDAAAARDAMQGAADFDGGPKDYDFSAPYNNDAAPQGTSFGTAADATAERSPGYADTLGANTPVPSSIDFGAAAANVEIGQRRARARPIIAIGWVAIVLTLILVGALFAVAPQAVVSMLPGAARLYSAIGMDVNGFGLAFENVRYEWNKTSGENVLEVQGQVANVSSAAMKVPSLEISLRDEKGDEISAWTTELDAPQLAAGEQAAFAAQIPSPPANVRSLRVRFDTAAAN